MNRTNLTINGAVLLVVAASLVGAGLLTAPSLISSQNASAQMSTSNTMAGSKMQGSQNQTMMGYGPNVTGSVAIEPTVAKAITSQVHISLANASLTAEKAVGTNAHAAAVRIGVVHGFLVYVALVIDSSYSLHSVIVDAGNGKVLASTQVALMGPGPGPGMMGPGPGPGMMGPGPGPGMMGPGPGPWKSYP
jgi:hypothetical protein